MVVLPLSRLPRDYAENMSTPMPTPDPNTKNEAVNWARIAAAATLITGGALLLTGRRKAGLLAATTGTALALLDQQDTLSHWWALLPGYIGDIQKLLSEAEGAVEEFAAQRDKLASALGR
jgi:hypothetical protein